MKFSRLVERSDFESDYYFLFFFLFFREGRKGGRGLPTGRIEPRVSILSTFLYRYLKSNEKFGIQRGP